MQQRDTQHRQTRDAIAILTGKDRLADGEAESKKSSREALKADAWQRSGVLGVASKLTRARDDAAAVEANARPLLAWLEAAESGEDLAVRRQALHQQSLNEDLADDDPERFLVGAARLYAFMTGGQES